MKIKFSKIIEAYEYASSGNGEDNCPVLCKSTGEIYYVSQSGEEFESLPSEWEESSDFTIIPGKHHFGHGKSIVFDFTNNYIPEYSSKVQIIFTNPGAYFNFNNLLKDLSLFEKWVKFESNIISKSLLEWCAEEGVQSFT